MGWLACPFVLTALSFSPFSFPPALKPASASPLPEIGLGPGPVLAGWRVLLSPSARSRVGQLPFLAGDVSSRSCGCMLQQMQSSSTIERSTAPLKERLVGVVLNGNTVGKEDMQRCENSRSSETKSPAKRQALVLLSGHATMRRDRACWEGGGGSEDRGSGSGGGGQTSDCGTRCSNGKKQTYVK